MLNGQRSWQDELAIIDRTMKAISGITDPERLIDVYWEGIGELLPVYDFIALSRRRVDPPDYLITRWSLAEDHPNPWTHRHLLPKLTGGLLGEIAYANKPVIIDDLPSRVSKDDPGWRYLEGYHSLIALPQYDDGEGLNVTVILLPEGAEFDRSTAPLIHWQSGLFGRGTQNLVLRNRLASALAILDRELQVVGEIQRSLLPGMLPAIKGFEVAAHYETSARAGGDYYDFFPLESDEWGVFIADVSGHGTPAAVLMAITHAIAHAQPVSHTPPAALLTFLNTQLTRLYTNAGTFITAFYASLQPESRTLTYSSAGHNPPRLVREGEVLSLDQAGALPLGIEEEQVYPEATVRLERGDLLLLYTDGITEAMAPADGAARSPDLFGTDRLDRLLLGVGACSARECVDRVVEEVRLFSANQPPTDDRTLIALRCL